MKRLCIYLTYDKQNIVDRYIGCMLKELGTCVDYIAVVCNETEIAGGLDILEEYADEIFYRKNIGYDAGGFKDALCDFLGWEKVLQYDELVLANDSMFGPFKPMEDIFAEMGEKDVDFWGLAKHGECQSISMGYMYEHIQSYFLVIRSRMLRCRQFRVYWEEMPYYAAFRDVVSRHEVRFTHYFSSLGYSFATLADTEPNDSVNIANNYMQYGMISYELIEKRNFPFLKKQQLAFNTLNLQTQQNLRQAIDYVKNATDYDVNLIWDNIIRTLNMADLQRSLHLQYIIPAGQDKGADRKVAVIVLVAFKESAEYILDYLRGVPSGFTVSIFSECSELLDIYEMQGIKCKTIKLNEIAEILAGFSNYDFVCMLHDADMSSDRKPSCIGKSYFYNVWENMIKSTEHIWGILDLFEKESRLGFLATPQPDFGEYFKEYGRGWNGNYKTVRHITEKLGLRCQVSGLKAPFRIAEDFWSRGCILKKLGNLEEEECPYLPYIWSYLAQDAGYYSGIVESSEYASIKEVNSQYYLNQIAAQVRRQYGVFDDFNKMKERILLGALERFCTKYPRILVYGIGDMAEKHKMFLPDVEAYVVSDGRDKPELFDGMPVRYLSEVRVSEDCGVVLCLDERNQEQVIPMLEEQGLKHHFCV
ncbi:MAG: rhamnan synthesis F family protein [Lachnospiraceae bacterium]|nr:rhamnan synthesis F family protein [Lachnospiraceae bacterium]